VDGISKQVIGAAALSVRVSTTVLAIFLTLLLAACSTDPGGPEDAEASAPDPTPTATDDAGALGWDEIVERFESSVVQVTAQFPSTVLNYQEFEQGVGVVISDSGHILTNAHLVDGATSLTVQTPDSGVISARVLGVNSCDALAVIRVDDFATLSPAPLGAQDGVRAGEDVALLTYPEGNDGTSSLMLRRGVVIHANQSVGRFPELVRHDASVGPEDAGAPIVNRAGDVIGISTISVENDGSSSDGFAINATLARSIANLLMDGRSQYWLGVNLQGNFFEDYYGTDAGLVVSAFASDSPAAMIGVEEAMLLTHVNGAEVNSMMDLCGILRDLSDDEFEVSLRLLQITESGQALYEGAVAISGSGAGAALQQTDAIAFDDVWDDEWDDDWANDDRDDAQSDPGFPAHIHSHVELRDWSIDELLDFAWDFSSPTEEEFNERLMPGYWIGEAELEISYWSECGGEWLLEGIETTYLDFEVAVGAPTDADPNPYSIVFLVRDFETEGAIEMLSFLQTDRYMEVDADGIYVAGKVLPGDFDDLMGHPAMTSHYWADPCDPDNEEIEVRYPLINSYTVFLGHLGSQTGFIELWGGTRDQQRGFYLTAYLTAADPESVND
jgi:S1-C subfamily serine protease